MRLSHSGFTIVEIVIVVGILSILLLIAVPNYVKTRRESAAAACIATMKQIEVAIFRWASDNSIELGQPVDENAVYGYLISHRPRCPAGGIYTLEPVGDLPPVRCTREDEGHTL